MGDPDASAEATEMRAPAQLGAPGDAGAVSRG